MLSVLIRTTTRTKNNSKGGWEGLWELVNKSMMITVVSMVIFIPEHSELYTSHVYSFLHVH